MIVGITFSQIAIGAICFAGIGFAAGAYVGFRVTKVINKLN